MIRFDRFTRARMPVAAVLFLAGAILLAQTSDLRGRVHPGRDEYAIGLPVAAVHEQAKLTAGDAADDDWFGWAVALSGETIAVGAIEDDDAGPKSGSVYLFVRGDTGWLEHAELIGGDTAAFDKFGGAVALDGDTLLVGAAGDDDDGFESGSVYVFVRNGSVWSEQAKLTASDGAANDQFGYSVAISGDTAIVGAYLEGEFDAGAAYVFVRDGTTWAEQAKLTGGQGGDLFGASVALDGDRALVGAVGANGPGLTSGAAHVFVRGGSEWSQQARLTASDAGPEDRFGNSVAIFGDTALVGAYHANLPGGFKQGAAYVFVRSGTSWSEQAKLTASDPATADWFGSSVVLEGSTAVVGAVGDNPDLVGDAGAAYVFLQDGTIWTEYAKLTASDGTHAASLGRSVALSGDTAVVGAERADTPAAQDAGAAYVFRVPPGSVADDEDEDADDEDGDESDDEFADEVATKWPGDGEDQSLSDLMASVARRSDISPWKTMAIIPTVTMLPIGDWK